MLHTHALPQVRIVESLNVYKYPGDLVLHEMQTFLDMGYHKLDDSLRLSSSLEKYLQEGDKRPIPRKQLPEGTELPPSVVDVYMSLSDTIGKLF